MRVELWEDVICSWCGIANERVAKAMERFGRGDDVELVHRSFRLLADLPIGESVAFADHMGNQRGLSAADAEAMSEQLRRIAASEGIEPYHVADNHIGNTTLAHEFLAWAAEQGKEHEAWRLLFRAHFGERAAIWTVDDLVPFAGRLGLDEDAARAALESGRHRAKVEGDHAEAVALGARGVPFLVIDRKYGVSGAQSVETIVDALETAWAQREPADA